jgi:hypothetical protein
MRFDARSAAVMDKAARGPAEIAARARYRVRPKDGLVRGGSFGALGASSLVDTVATKGGSIAATSGGTSLAAAMGAGAAAGPIGLVVGAIVGIVLSKIFNKQYLDVTSANTIADASLGVFQQYQQIAGQVAGRQIGLASMDAIWKGAMYAGLFPLNNQQLCFHNGCLKYKGQPEWIEATINGPDNQFTLGGNYQAFVNGAVNAAAAPVSSTGTTMPISAGNVIGRAQLKGLGSRARRFTGLGALGAINGVPEAVVLVDNYLIPANTRDNPAWLVPRTALEHQILYDVADAWLYQNHPELNSTPFVATSPAAQPMPVSTFGVQPSPNPVPVAPQPVQVIANPPVLTAPVATPGVITPVTFSTGLPQPILTPIAVSSGVQMSPGGATLFQAAPADATGVATTADALASANNSFSDFISTPLGLLTLVGIGVAVLAVLKK